MKNLLISKIPGITAAPDKQKLVDELYDDLKPIAREKNGRLGDHKLVNEDSLQITIANDDLWPVIKDAVEKAGMKIVELKATEAFAAKYRAIDSQKS